MLQDDFINIITRQALIAFSVWIQSTGNPRCLGEKAMSSFCPVTPFLHPFRPLSWCFLALITPTQILIFPSPPLKRLLYSSCCHVQPTLMKHRIHAQHHEINFPSPHNSLGRWVLLSYFTDEETKVQGGAVTYLRL